MQPLRSRYFLPFLFFSGLTMSSAAVADSLLQGFTVTNQSLPASLQGLQTANTSVLSATGLTSVQLDWTNDYTNASRGQLPGTENQPQESIVLDVETVRLSANFAWRFSQQWAIEAIVPVVHYGGGMLDASIDTWHDWTGLPDGNRDAVPRDRLRVFARTGGIEQFDLHSDVTGLGDVQLAIARCHRCDGGRSGAVGWRGVSRAQLKLPTGDSDDLMGNGAAHIALSSQWHRAVGARWMAQTGVGAAWLQRGELLVQQQRQWAMWGQAGIGYRATDALALKAQLSAHTPLYQNTALPQLAQAAVQLAVGLSWLPVQHVKIDVALVENPQPRSAPDVGLHLNLSLLRR